MPEQVYHFKYRVPYSDCTVGNHIYYSRYLDILEAARGEFFRSLGIPLLALQEQNIIFPVIECRVRYKYPARYDDVLDVSLWITRMGGVKLAFGYQIENQANKPVLEAETMHACTAIEEKPKRMPAELTVLLQPYVKVTPEIVESEK